MDNKQKKTMFKLIYKTLLVFVCLLSLTTIYFSSLSYEICKSFLFIAVIICACLAIFIALIDGYKTNKIKNKYMLGIFIYTLILVAITFIICSIVLSYKNWPTVINYSINGALCLATAFVLLICAFIVGLKLSKLYQNITLTIDSTSETPNYNDELNLKKRLDELNRKLEIKKIQEKIDSAQKELDEK